ncbi:serine hydrolase domain-containing protein [Granulicatella seriolae]|uniref:Beta-lactamase family protein n=1 Tax=Granulicatella seriolae TaxID=2967226 RepID=A0ABT1WNS6_9LACT|nr:serine hydrolase domain-containing protein [Granulicatella seriolae]
MTYSKTKALLEQYRKSRVFPGYSAALLLPDNQVEKLIVGQAQLSPQVEELTDGLYYDLASLTKVLATTSLVLQLLEDGQLDIDSSISNYFPQAKEPKVTLRHLITHTSGLEGYIPNRASLSANQLVEALLQLSCGPTFNKEVKYTDTGFVLLGKVLEKITQKSVADLFQENIAKPLGLRHMSYGPLPAHVCVPTEIIVPNKTIRGTVHDPKASVLGRHCGSAGLFASLDDVITYTQALLNGGENILQRPTVDSLLHDWTPNQKVGRSLGWDIQDFQGARWLKHTGFTGTLVMWNLETQKAFILLTNRIHTLKDTAQYNQLRDQLILTFLQETM